MYRDRSPARADIELRGSVPKRYHDVDREASRSAEFGTWLAAASLEQHDPTKSRWHLGKWLWRAQRRERPLRRHSTRDDAHDLRNVATADGPNARDAEPAPTANASDACSRTVHWHPCVTDHSGEPRPKRVRRRSRELDQDWGGASSSHNRRPMRVQDGTLARSPDLQLLKQRPWELIPEYQVPQVAVYLRGRELWPKDD